MNSSSFADPRKPWVAVMLSLFSTGLGHIYSGQFVKGILLFTMSIAFAPLMFLAALIGSGTAVLLSLFLTAGLITAVYFYAAIDSYFAARRAPPDFQRQDFNRLPVYLLFILLSILLPLGAAVQIKENIFEAYVCPARSMAPSLIPGDRFLINKTVYHPAEPEHGEIVVFRNPDERGQMYIKRVIGLPGDTVAVREDEVLLNGKKLTREERSVADSGWLRETVSGKLYQEMVGSRSYLIAVDPAAKPIEDFSETKVPRGQCFVLGDNRSNSRDSRFFGFVPLGDVVGRVQYMYFPAGSWARFGAIEAN